MSAKTLTIYSAEVRKHKNTNKKRYTGTVELTFHLNAGDLKIKELTVQKNKLVALVEVPYTVYDPYEGSFINSNADFAALLNEEPDIIRDYALDEVYMELLEAKVLLDPVKPVISKKLPSMTKDK